MQMTSSRRWDLNRAPPPLRGQGPQPVSTDPDSASTQPARPSILPSSAPLSRGLCPEAPLCSPPVRDHIPWISLRCAPVWSPRWHAETWCNPTVAWMSVKPTIDPRWESPCLEPLPLSVSSLSLLHWMEELEVTSVAFRIRGHAEGALSPLERLIKRLFSLISTQWWGKLILSQLSVSETWPSKFKVAGTNPNISFSVWPAADMSSWTTALIVPPCWVFSDTDCVCLNDDTCTIWFVVFIWFLNFCYSSILYLYSNHTE